MCSQPCPPLRRFYAKALVGQVNGKDLTLPWGSHRRISEEVAMELSPDRWMEWWQVSRKGMSDRKKGSDTEEGREPRGGFLELSNKWICRNGQRRDWKKCLEPEYEGRFNQTVKLKLGTDHMVLRQDFKQDNDMAKRSSFGWNLLTNIILNIYSAWSCGGYLAVPHGVRNLSSSTRDQTCGPCSGSAESKPMDC